MKKLSFFIVWVLFIYNLSCNNRSEVKIPEKLSDTNQASKKIDTSINEIVNNDPQNKNSQILDLTKQVLKLIKDKEYLELANFIHPTLGIRLEDVVLKVENFRSLISNKNKINWGIIGPVDDSTILPVTDYFKKYVYDQDYLNSDKFNINKIINNCNDIVNTQGPFKNSDFVECYFNHGNDVVCRNSLDLFFQKYNEKYYLIGIIQDSWEP